LALHYAEENPDELVAALEEKTEAVICEGGELIEMIAIECSVLVRRNGRTASKAALVRAPTIGGEYRARRPQAVSF
jgi:hypothetical protein